MSPENVSLLNHFWITFPNDPAFPIGQGVTAYSKEDAFQLLGEAGYDFYLKATRVNVLEISKVSDVPEFDISQSAGPIRFRGIWYPCLNIGIGASGK